MALHGLFQPTLEGSRACRNKAAGKVLDRSILETKMDTAVRFQPASRSLILNVLDIAEQDRLFPSRIRQPILVDGERGIAADSQPPTVGDQDSRNQEGRKGADEPGPPPLVPLTVFNQERPAAR